MDKDLSNNTSTVRTPVIAEGVDLVMATTTSEPCLDIYNGNEFTLSVSNMGSKDLDYSATNQIVVKEILPAGVSISNRSHNGWNYSLVGSTHTFTKTGSGTLASGMVLPPISFTLNSAQDYSGNGEVNLISTAGTAAVSTEPAENQGNNFSDFSVAQKPPAPTVESPIYYCLNETALPLTATPAVGNELRWYLHEGGIESQEAFIPNTSYAGTTTYYVSQTNGSCESELREVKVIVQPTPTAGSLVAESQEICPGTVPVAIGSSAAGTVAGTAVISYRWESSVDNGITWKPVSGTTTESFQPGEIFQDTKYRRITIATEGGASCQSGVTNEVTVTTKICSVISNPMLPSKAQ